MGATDIPTMKDVAREADVSLASVSNFLNHPSRLAPSTQERVRDAIARLGYIRNGAARDLKRSGSDGIGLIVPDIVNRLFVDIARGAQISAKSRLLSLLMGNALYTFESFARGETSDQQDQFLDYFAEQRVRGILYAAMSDPSEGIRRIRSHVRPIVVINYDQQGDWCSVLMDNAQAGRLAAEHLASTGVRTVYYLSPLDIAQPLAERRRGVRDAAHRLGLQLIEVEMDGFWFDQGREAAERLLTARPTGPRIGVVGVTDELALGVLSVLRERPEVQVPQDVAVMGIDGTHHGSDSDWISLTGLEFPGIEMGETATRLVLDEAVASHRHERVVLPVALRRGRST